VKERQGLIQREIGPRDRRSFVIWLTPEGKKLAGRLYRFKRSY